MTTFTDNERAAVARLGVTISELESMAKENGRNGSWTSVIGFLQIHHGWLVALIDDAAAPKEPT